MLKKRHTQKGFTLVELMIGVLVGLIIVAAGISLFITSVKGQSDNIKLSRLNQDMRSMMDIMARDIRRAGFVTNTPDSYWASLQNNPFFDNVTSGATTDIAVYNTNTCIVYAYNANNDGPPIVNSAERFGFRLSNTGELEMRSSGGTNENCTDGQWESITEPEVEITGLTFTLTSTTLNATSMATDTDGDGCPDGDDQNPNSASSSCITGLYGNKLCDSGEACNTCTRDGSPDPACLYVRNVTILLAGRLRGDTGVTQSITEQVRVRNDKFLAAIP
ncbi:prepilin-type N-terminal cleavage/methylation domain-containing protein [Methylomicrobium sp. Wu6]|uniref:PilW family protein n=1 Tax=Methylomicrobium sp. Wu6 TaxID=3107928 RepID=UPI002DD61F32|nr:prepilin-type N-terminal cleavage/methylation domain-containing protein [Methylomicrobium sp. Wu6]MEC4747467.1 prepilin-type N-terminal cleavage/methylation domain-containing protein [Methylomicrobium sp. Wu6]